MRRTLTPAVSADDHRRGADDALITLVEYGDFECPHCGRAFPIVEALQREFGSTLRFVFRHFPLSEIHAHAELAAESTEAAAAQGQFWAMHRMLFQQQHALEPHHLLKYAQQLGLDMNQFRKDLGGRTFRKRVHEHFMGGVRSGVNGTPTFFLNGVRWDGHADFQNLATAIRESVGGLQVGSIR